jgi:hypothetical protein
MREVVRFPADACLPTAEGILAGQGVPAGRQSSEPVAESLRQALELFRKLAAPTTILSDITTAEFAAVYDGEGRNAPDSPLAGIFPKAERLTLFAVTIGEQIGEEISRLFAGGRYDLGYLLDAVASSGTDRLAQKLQEYCAGRNRNGSSPPRHKDIKVGAGEVRSQISEVRMQKSGVRNLGGLGDLGGSIPAGSVFLRYSPGYCGWDITGQRQLFQALRPEEVGITLRESCLMEPLKSISGVLVAARPEAHRFDNTYPFCTTCTTQTCRSRIAAIDSEADRIATKTRNERARTREPQNP